MDINYTDAPLSYKLSSLAQSIMLAIFLLFCIYFLSIALFLSSHVSNAQILNYNDFNLSLSLVSLFIFTILLAIGLLNRAYYFFCLPLVILLVPNAINDLFPSYWAGPVTERGAASVAIMTHIDLFLIGGVFLFSDLKGGLVKDSKALSRTLIFFVFFYVYKLHTFMEYHELICPKQSASVLWE